MISLTKKKWTQFFIIALVIFSWKPAWSCFDLASKTYDVPVEILKAIAKVESNNNDLAINVNKNGTRDIGKMQINSIWLTELEKHNIDENDLLDPCQNILVGAWILRRSIDKYGFNWKGIAAYHSATPALNLRYAWKIYKKWQGHNHNSAWIAELDGCFCNPPEG